LGIGLQHVLENVLRRAVPERVLIQHALVEELLSFRFAGRLEIDGSKLFAVGLRVRGLRQRNTGRKRHRHCKGGSHRASPWLVAAT